MSARVPSASCIQPAGLHRCFNRHIVGPWRLFLVVKLYSDPTGIGSDCIYNDLKDAVLGSFCRVQSLSRDHEYQINDAHGHVCLNIRSSK